MLTPPPVFRSPAPGEKLRVLDLVSLRGPVAGRAERFVADKCRYFETASGVEHRVVVPAAEAGEDRWSESRVHAVASPRLPGAAGARVLIDRARVWEIATEFRPHVIE
ncbi:MAG: hypothetical protein H7067_20300, partial [Burkholderiales bacterium]|nr:hypothetical protein [Opitutaceae bacterium]